MKIQWFGYVKLLEFKGYLITKVADVKMVMNIEYLHLVKEGIKKS